MRRRIIKGLLRHGPGKATSSKNEADLRRAFLRFLPLLNNPLIGAGARRIAAGKPKIAPGF
jgi:hypothetical protein